MIPPEMALSPLVGLLQSPQILMAVSLDHPIKNARKIFDKRVKVRRLRQRKRQKSDFEKKNYVIISYFQKAAEVKISSYPIHFIPQTQIIVIIC